MPIAAAARQERTFLFGLIITTDPGKAFNATDTMITDDFGTLVPIGWEGVGIHCNEPFQ